MKFSPKSKIDEEEIGGQKAIFSKHNEMIVWVRGAVVLQGSLESTAGSPHYPWCCHSLEEDVVGAEGVVSTVQAMGSPGHRACSLLLPV